MTGVSFEEYLQLLDLTERLRGLEVSGPYSARKTLKLLDKLVPPFEWLSSGAASDIDTNSPGYREIADIFESVRTGNLDKPYNSRIANGEPAGTSPRPGKNVNPSRSFPDHISVLVDHVKYDRISSNELLHYLYSQKKSHLLETYNDKVVNILLLYIMTYSMAMSSNDQITHSEVLDSLASENGDDWQSD